MASSCGGCAPASHQTTSFLMVSSFLKARSTPVRRAQDLVDLVRRHAVGHQRAIRGCTNGSFHSARLPGNFLRSKRSARSWWARPSSCRRHRRRRGSRGWSGRRTRASGADEVLLSAPPWTSRSSPGCPRRRPGGRRGIDVDHVPGHAARLSTMARILETSPLYSSSVIFAPVFACVGLREGLALAHLIGAAPGHHGEVLRGGRDPAAPSSRRHLPSTTRGG